MTNDRRPTPAERPSAQGLPPKLFPQAGAVSLDSDAPARWWRAVVALALVVIGFVAICGHAEFMAMQRDRCLDQLHAVSRGR